MPLGKIFKGALALLLHYRRELSKALVFPLLGYLIVGVAMVGTTNTLTATMGSLLSMALQCLIAVTVHRVLLLGPESVEHWGPRRWTSKDSKFLLHMVGLVLIITFSMLPFLLLAAFSPAITLLGALICYTFVSMRLSLVFPAIAIERDFGYRDAWLLSSRYLKEMFFTVALVPLLVMLPMLPLALMFAFSPLAMDAVATVWSILATVFIIAALSVTYKGIVEAEAKLRSATTSGQDQSDQ